MGRQELHSSTVTPQQPSDITDDDLSNRESEIIIADQLPKKEYAEELLFNEEPMKIRIEPERDATSSLAQPNWVNGIGAEILFEGRWRSVTHLPTGIVFTTKRKYVANMATSKTTTVKTFVEEKQSEDPINHVRKNTTQALTFSVIEDKNPRGAAWLTELLSRR